jgi:hypothetical protein
VLENLYGFIIYKFYAKIQMDENINIIFFDEKKLQVEYEKKHGKKPNGNSIADFPTIYNIESTFLFSNPIRLIDIVFFGDI